MSVSKLALIPIFAALTAAGAFIRLPAFPVPFTLQNLFVVMSGMMLGPRAGALSQVVYILMGLMGLPVFSGGGGPGYVLSPTFGYLLGFVAASAASGYLMEDKPFTMVRAGAASLAGMLCVYAVGVPYLAFYLSCVLDKPDAFWIALKTGFAIFLPGDLAKCAILAVVMPRLVRVLEKSNLLR